MGVDSAGRRAVFLDRDGVITRAAVRDGKPFAVVREEELDILPGVAGALQRLRRAGFSLIVVTNQPEVARGSLDPVVLERMHRRLRRELPLDDVRSCVHDDRDQCSCRKPAPGLIVQAAKDHRLSLAESFVVGDRWRDIEAGRRAGCTTVFVERGYEERRPERPDAVVRSLDEAADWILARPQDRL